MIDHEHAPDPEQLERLRAGFAAAEPGETDTSTPIAPEQIWAAARGELGPQETAAIVDRLHHDPQLALEWRLAAALSDAPEQADEAVPAASNDRRYLYVGVLAAAAAAAVLLVMIQPRPEQGSPRSIDGARPGLRSAAGKPALSTTLAEGTELTRERFELRWSALPDAGRYELRVSTEALDPVHHALELDEPRALIPAEALVGCEPGDVLLWQVTAVTVDGARVSGPVWRVVLR
jgi:hypothetical protein